MDDIIKFVTTLLLHSWSNNLYYIHNIPLGILFKNTVQSVLFPNIEINTCEVVIANPQTALVLLMIPVSNFVLIIKYLE